LNKKYALAAEQIAPLVSDGRGCLATDKITVEGRPVGYMYRLEPNNSYDTGWCFFAGDEDDAYMDVVDHHGVYALNTIANYDRAIIPYLEAPVGSAFYRNGAQFVADPLGPPKERP
jgi:hypothetical protein